MRPDFALLFTVLLLVIGCNKDEDPVERTFDDVQADFSNIPLTDGTQDVTLELNDNQFWSFRVIPPKSLGSSTYPLIIRLHGASAGYDEAHLGTECLIEPGFESLNAFILSPNAGDSEWFEPENQEKLGTLINLAINLWPVDASKLVLVGYSNGGNGSWYYAEHQANTFSAGIPIASSYHNDTSVKIDVPLYVIHGEDDELFPVDSTRKWVEEYQDSGGDIKFVVAEGLTHFLPCEYISYLQDASAWLEEQVW